LRVFSSEKVEILESQPRAFRSHHRAPAQYDAQDTHI
jgi:hypothetical protein